MERVELEGLSREGLLELVARQAEVIGRQRAEEASLL